MNPEELGELGIAVHTIKGYGDTAVAECAVALMWTAARGFAQMDREMRAGTWLRDDGMNAYTVADAYAFVDVPKTVLSSFTQTRLAFRVRNLTDRRYAAWGDAGYTDQIILGAPRSYEVSASFKW